MKSITSLAILCILAIAGSAFGCVTNDKSEGTFIIDESGCVNI